MRPLPVRIRAMNTMYKLPIHNSPIMPINAADLLTKFKKTLSDEVDEIDEIIAAAGKVDKDFVPNLQLSVMLADLLGDIVVYCYSEALKYGLPMDSVLDIIMDSNESKLGKDGNPIYDANGKFLKGPNYWKPEPKIEQLLLKMMNPQPLPNCKCASLDVSEGGHHD